MASGMSLNRWSVTTGRPGPFQPDCHARSMIRSTKAALRLGSLRLKCPRAGRTPELTSNGTKSSKRGVLASISPSSPDPSANASGDMTV